MDQLSTAPINVVLMVNAVAGLAVLWSRRVPNAITLPYLGAALVNHFLVGGLPGLTWSLAAAIVGIAILIPPCLLGSTNPGDVKLIAGASAWVATPSTFRFYLAVALAALVYAAVLLWRQGTLKRLFLNVRIMALRIRAMGRYLLLVREFEEDRPTNRSEFPAIPLGAILTAAVLVVLLLNSLSKTA